MNAAPIALNNNQVQHHSRTSAISSAGCCVANNSNHTNKKNYSTTELECLNKCVAAVLPISSDEWEMVAHSHCVYYPGCTWESLCKKFNEVARKSIPTGDLNRPSCVGQAKRVHQQIIKKSKGSSGSPSEGSPLLLMMIPIH